MSNGDDVLDNWEEIDEDGLNSIQKLKTSSVSSFERIVEDSYQNTHFSTPTAAPFSSTITTSSFRPNAMKLLQRSSAEDSAASSSKPLPKSPLDDMSASFQPVMMVLHKPQDEYQSANYTAPIVNQTVKILRRPTQSTENRSNCIRPKQPIKTLQQREQEYAEARLRILGSAKNPEDEEELASTAAPAVAAVSCSTLFIPGTNQCNNLVNQQVQQQQHQYLQNYQLQHQQQQQQPQQQQNYFYNMPQPQSPAFNNNRTYNMNPVLALGSMGAIGQPDQYHTTKLSSPQAQQQHLKYPQYHQKLQQQNKTQQPQQQTWSPVVGGSVSSSSLRQQQIQQQQQNDTILRLPRGPDGTTGFQMRR